MWSTVLNAFEKSISVAIVGKAVSSDWNRRLGLLSREEGSSSRVMGVETVLGVGECNSRGKAEKETLQGFGVIARERDGTLGKCSVHWVYLFLGRGSD